MSLYPLGLPTRPYLLIGEAPAPDSTKKHLDVALACRALGMRPKPGICGYLRTRHRDLFGFVMVTAHVNLLRRWPGPQGKGSRFPVEEGRQAAQGMLQDLERREDDPTHLILCGRRVAAAFGIRSAFFEWHFYLAERPVVVVPHPSGVSTWYNDRGNRKKALEFLKGLGERGR